MTSLKFDPPDLPKAYRVTAKISGRKWIQEGRFERMELRRYASSTPGHVTLFYKQVGTDSWTAITREEFISLATDELTSDK